MTITETKKKALKDYKELKKLLKQEKPDILSIHENLLSYPNFSHHTYFSQNRGILEFHYGDMTLKISVNCGIIELDKEIKLWNHDGDGFIGDFTEKTLNLDASGDLD